MFKDLWDTSGEWNIHFSHKCFHFKAIYEHMEHKGIKPQHRWRTNNSEVL